jgi:hypothetical protein
MEEDLRLPSPKNDSPKKPKIRRQVSLMTELESIDEVHTEPAFHSYTLSRGQSEKSLSIGLTESIAHIAGKKTKEQVRRKDPSEEYFTLVFAK